MTWREQCRPIIAEVIKTVGLDDMKVLRKALRDAYPYGERKMWPYKVWCSEIRKQMEIPEIPDMSLFEGGMTNETK